MVAPLTVDDRVLLDDALVPKGDDPAAAMFHPPAASVPVRVADSPRVTGTSSDG